MGFGEGVAFPCMQVLIKTWVPGDKRTRALGLVYSGEELANNRSGQSLCIITPIECPPMTPVPQHAAVHHPQPLGYEGIVVSVSQPLALKCIVMSQSQHQAFLQRNAIHGPAPYSNGY
jgi:hypothetical protein